MGIGGAGGRAGMQPGVTPIGFASGPCSWSSPNPTHIPALALQPRVHVSELERARDEALAEAAPRVSARSRVEDGLERVDLPALDALPIHRSQLEKEQAAAKALGLPPRGGAGPARGGAAAAAAEAGQPGLDSLVKHRSRLERERDAALALGAPRASPRPAQAGAAAEGRGMPALGSFPVHKSRLEREKEAAAMEREAGGGWRVGWRGVWRELGVGGEGHGWCVSGGRKTIVCAQASLQPRLGGVTWRPEGP